MSPLFVVAHGAGAGQSHPFMRAWVAQLATLGSVVAFEYAYMAAGRKAPDRLSKLLEVHAEAVKAAVSAHPGRSLVLVGKSMGSRVGCHLAAALAPEHRLAGLVCLGYPLQGASSLRDEVLRSLPAPVLFVQGDRDPLCPLPLLAQARAAMPTASTLHVVPGGDHSLALRKRDIVALGVSQEASDARAFAAVRRFIQELSP